MNSEGTWLSALALLPAMSVFLAVLTLNRKERQNLSLMLIAFAVLSGFMALVQTFQGAESPFRFYNLALNDKSPVGFFVNRNHLGALLYSAGAFAVTWLLSSLASIRSNFKPTDNRKLTIATGSAFALLALLSVELVVRSRAGVLLFLGGLLCVFLISILRSPRHEFIAHDGGARAYTPHDWSRLGGVFLLLAVIAFVFVGSSSLQGLISRLGADPLANERPVFAKVTLTAATAFLPFGSGLGTFVPTYQMFEKPNHLIAGVYANHAHNDLLEIALEAGLGGLFLLSIFLYWLMRHLRKVVAIADREDPTYAYLLDAAVLTIVLLLCHSLVDYPLRTSALMSIFAFSCALLVKPATGTEREIYPDRPMGTRSVHRHGGTEIGTIES